MKTRFALVVSAAAAVLGAALAMPAPANAGTHFSVQVTDAGYYDAAPRVAQYGGPHFGPPRAYGPPPVYTHPGYGYQRPWRRHSRWHDRPHHPQWGGPQFYGRGW